MQENRVPGSCSILLTRNAVVPNAGKGNEYYHPEGRYVLMIPVCIQYFKMVRELVGRPPLWDDIGLINPKLAQAGSSVKASSFSSGRSETSLVAGEKERLINFGKEAYFFIRIELCRLVPMNLLLQITPYSQVSLARALQLSRRLTRFSISEQRFPEGICHAKIQDRVVAW